MTHEPPTPTPAPEPGEQPQRSWVEGFRDIMVAPTELASTLGQHVGKVFVAALLLLTVTSAAVNWLHSRSPALRAQLEELTLQQLERYFAKNPQLSSEERQRIRETVPEGLRFSLARSLLGGLFTNVISLLAVLGLLWLLQLPFAGNLQRVRFAVLAAALGYSCLPGALGELLNAAVQVLGGSLQFQLSPAAFVSPFEHPIVFSVLSRLHVGTVAQYALLGIVLADAASLRSRLAGVAWSFAALGIWLGAIATLGRLMA